MSRSIYDWGGGERVRDLVGTSTSCKSSRGALEPKFLSGKGTCSPKRNSSEVVLAISSSKTFTRLFQLNTKFIASCWLYSWNSRASTGVPKFMGGVFSDLDVIQCCFGELYRKVELFPPGMSLFIRVLGWAVDCVRNVDAEILRWVVGSSPSRGKFCNLSTFCTNISYSINSPSVYYSIDFQYRTSW